MLLASLDYINVTMSRSEFLSLMYIFMSPSSLYPSYSFHVMSDEGFPLMAFTC